MRTLSATVIAGYAVLGAASATAQTSAPADPLRAYVPSTVSPEAAALYARYRSRVENTFGDKLLSAMRFGFGGHVEMPQ